MEEEKEALEAQSILSFGKKLEDLTDDEKKLLFQDYTGKRDLANAQYATSQEQMFKEGNQGITTPDGQFIAGGVGNVLADSALRMVAARGRNKAEDSLNALSDQMAQGGQLGADLSAGAMQDQMGHQMALAQAMGGGGGQEQPPTQQQPAVTRGPKPVQSSPLVGNGRGPMAPPQGQQPPQGMLQGMLSGSPQSMGVPQSPGVNYPQPAPQPPPSRRSMNESAAMYMRGNPSVPGMGGGGMDPESRRKQEEMMRMMRGF